MATFANVTWTNGNPDTLSALVLPFEAGETTTWTFACADSPVVSLVGVPLELLISRYDGFQPERAIGDSQFSNKTSGGGATLATTYDNTSDLGGRAWHGAVRRSDTLAIIRKMTLSIGGAAADPETPSGPALPHSVFAGPSSGTVSGEGGYRYLVPADLPGVTATTAGILCIPTDGGQIAPVTVVGATFSGSTLTVPTPDLSSYIPQGGTLSASLNAGGHTVRIAALGDAVVDVLVGAGPGTSTVFGTDDNGAVSQSTAGTQAKFDAAGNLIVNAGASLSGQLIANGGISSDYGFVGNFPMNTYNLVANGGNQSFVIDNAGLPIFGGRQAFGSDGSTVAIDWSAGYPAIPTATTGTNTTQAASTAFVQAALVSIWKNKGDIDCSANPNYPAASNGDTYRVSVAGKVGGASGTSVDAGDVVSCKADNAGGTQASVGASWYVIEHNLVGAVLAANNLSDLTNAATARSNLGLGNVDNTSDATKNAATATLSGKTINGASNTLIVRIGNDVTGLGTGVATALAIAQDGLSPSAIGFLGLPQVSVSAARTIAASDHAKCLYHPSADTTARTWTIDSNANLALPVGFVFSIYNDGSAGIITLAITTDTLVLSGTGATGSRLIAPYGFATFWKKTSNSWVCFPGSGVT